MKLKSENLFTRLFDKRNYFNFKHLQLMSHFESNVHISIKRNVFKNYLIPIERLNSEVKDMVIFDGIRSYYNECGVDKI